MLSLFVLYIAHNVACVFYFVATLVDSDEDDSWITHYGINKLNIYEKYSVSLYYSVVTMCTVGYGDYSPINISEKIAVIFVSFISCGTFAYAINAIGVIVDNLQKKDNQFNQDMTSLIKYMKIRGVNQITQLRVRRYFEYLHHENIQEDNKNETLINQLTGSLKLEVYKELYLNILLKQPLLSQNFSEEFLEKLSFQMKESVIGPDEYLLRKGEENDKLYFIVKGTVASHVQLSNEMRQYSIFQKSDMMGEQSFFTKNPPQIFAKSKNVVTYLYLTKTDFEKLYENFPQDYEQFFKIKDSLNIYKKQLQIKCSSCKKLGHQFRTCPLLHYTPNIDRVIEQNKTQQTSQSRSNSLIRKTKIFKNTLTIREVVKEDMIAFLDIQGIFQDNQEILDRIDLMNGEKNQSSLSGQRSSKGQNRNSNGEKIPKNNITQSHIPEIMTTERISKFFNYSRIRDNMCHERLSRIPSPMQLSGIKNRVEFQFENKDDEIEKEAESFEIYSYQKIVQIDKQKSYNSYFPHNNLENILKSYNDRQKKSSKYQKLRKILEQIQNQRKQSIQKLGISPKKKKSQDYIKQMQINQGVVNSHKNSTESQYA